MNGPEVAALKQNLKNSSLSERRIGFFGPLMGVGVDCGYGYSAVELIKGFQRAGVPVWYGDRDAPVALSYGQPHFYEYVPGAYNIGYTCWESTLVPPQWVHYMNKMDEIWAGCEFNAQQYRDAGVTVPVLVLPLGINADHYPAVAREIKETYSFLHVGSQTKRKGAKLVYEVFKDLYGNSKEVFLTLKGRPEFKVTGKNVFVIEHQLTQDGMRNLYHDHDFMIYPTNGEGFGLIPFQAAATGMPAAVTNWSGPVDFMDFCYPIESLGLVEADYEPHEGLWADPNPYDVEFYMNDFVNSADTYFEVSYHLAGRLHQEYSWDRIAEIALERMFNSLN